MPFIYMEKWFFWMKNTIIMSVVSTFILIVLMVCLRLMHIAGAYDGNGVRW